MASTGGPAAGYSGLTHSSRAITALLVRRWIFVLEHLLDPKVWKFRVAIISQEQSLATIADKYQGFDAKSKRLSIRFLKAALRAARSRRRRYTPNGWYPARPLTSAVSNGVTAWVSSNQMYSSNCCAGWPESSDWRARFRAGR